jgi:osmotically-inducible protein OsmY
MSARAPRTYDEIIARIVPDPDSSYRPTPQQQREAYERKPPPRDEALAAKVWEALREIGADNIAMEVDGDRVILRGAVADLHTWHRIEAVVSSVDGVEEIDNRMHVV